MTVNLTPRAANKKYLSGLRAGGVLLALLLLTANVATAQDAPKSSITNVAQAQALSSTGEVLTASAVETVGVGVGRRGTTLEATTNVTNACTMPDGRLWVSGIIDVYNGGEVATQNLTAVVSIEYKIRRMQFTPAPGATQTLDIRQQLDPGERGRYPFSIIFAPIKDATYRAAAKVTITNHSGRLGIAFGPEPKDDVTGNLSVACYGQELAEGRLEIAAQASVLEVSLGEALTYVVTVRNAGETRLDNIVIHNELPEGVRLSQEHMLGSASARLDGRNLSLGLDRSMEPGEERVVSYRVTFVSGGKVPVLDNRARAEANGGHVRSAEAEVLVRVVQGFALQSRTVIGSVWLDVNNNGRRDSGEPGVAGIDIWSADGEVVRTDSEGRFSFRNMRAGTHVFRLDEQTLSGDLGLARRSDALTTVRLDGWTTPRADFRLVPQTQPMANAGRAPSMGAAAAPHADSVAALPVTRPSIAPLRTEAEREEDRSRSFTGGPRVRFANPVDGTVVSSNRLIVVVAGEPSRAVRLFNGAELLREAVLRPDGRMDFVGIELAEGTHQLRVAMRNSWNQEVWDSLAVHRSGTPASFEIVTPLADLRANDRAMASMQVRVLDTWGVPVPGGRVTVEADGARIMSADVDRSSVGMQLAAGRDGVITLDVQAAQQVGNGEIRIKAGEAQKRVPVRTLPTTRSMIAVGAAQVGIGATTESFGALTVQGSIGKEASLSVSYDSRRQAQPEDFFGRGFDPLDEASYALHGDASERRVLSSSTQSISARLEHRHNWVQLGDINTGEFGGTGRLATYQRAVTGVGARYQTGAVVWRGFGSITDQVLSQMQVRADGSSGPYRVGANIRPGTERISIEVRAADNAARVIARETLNRYIDYQIDYRTGEVLLQRPVPSMDAAGNHLFIVASIERRTGADQRFLGGLRADIDARGLVGWSGTDSLNVYVLAVHDGSDAAVGASQQDVVGTGVRLQHGGFYGAGELLNAVTRENAFAGRASAGWKLREDAANVSAEWMRISSGFDPMADPRLGAGMQDVRLSAGMRVTKGAVARVTHNRQRFDGYHMERRNTQLQFDQQLMGRTVTSQAGLSTDILAMDRPSSSLMTGRLQMPVTDKANVWLEGAHALQAELPIAAAPARPSQVGVGASYQVFKSTHFEAMQRWVGIGEPGSDYALTSMKLRTESPLGAVWGGVEHAAADQSANALSFGLSPRFKISQGWTVNAMLERKFGLERASLLDVQRAMPFPQLEQDRWSSALGTQWIAADTLSRFRLQGELHGGELSGGHRIEMLGETQLNAALAVITRHDWWRQERALGMGEEVSRRDRSLLGLALRPTDSGTLNILSKLEWRRSINPGTGTRFSSRGEDQRLIGMLDAIWSVNPGTEVSARYAVRSTLLTNQPLTDQLNVDGGLGNTVAHYLGGQTGQHVYGSLSARIDGRVLMSGGHSTWNVAPSLAVRLNEYLEVEGGYRFGTMQDIDFSGNGGTGMFLSLGVRFSESMGGRITDFWRDRVAAGR